MYVQKINLISWINQLLKEAPLLIERYSGDFRDISDEKRCMLLILGFIGRQGPNERIAHFCHPLIFTGKISNFSACETILEDDLHTICKNPFTIKFDRIKVDQSDEPRTPAIGAI